MRQKHIYIILMAIAGMLGICCFIVWRLQTRLSHYQGIFLTWDGCFSLDEFRGPGTRDLVCIVQYTYKHSPRFVPDAEGDEWTCAEQKENLLNPPIHSIVKVYIRREEIEPILKALNQPEYPAYSSKHRKFYTIQSDHCLVLLSISRRFEMPGTTYAVHIPYVLTENGFAVTPRGKDRRLYNILTAALEEWDAQTKTEYEEKEGLAKKTEAAYRLFQQAREANQVDYSALFEELKKLGVDCKDPNEIRRLIEGEKEARCQIDPNLPDWQRFF